MIVGLFLMHNNPNMKYHQSKCMNKKHIEFAQIISQHLTNPSALNIKYEDERYFLGTNVLFIF